MCGGRSVGGAVGHRRPVRDQSRSSSERVRRHGRGGTAGTGDEGSTLLRETTVDVDLWSDLRKPGREGKGRSRLEEIYPLDRETGETRPARSTFLCRHLPPVPHPLDELLGQPFRLTRGRQVGWIGDKVLDPYPVSCVGVEGSRTQGSLTRVHTLHHLSSQSLYYTVLHHTLLLSPIITTPSRRPPTINYVPPTPSADLSPLTPLTPSFTRSSPGHLCDRPYRRPSCAPPRSTTHSDPFHHLHSHRSQADPVRPGTPVTVPNSKTRLTLPSGSSQDRSSYNCCRDNDGTLVQSPTPDVSTTAVVYRDRVTPTDTSHTHQS